MNILNILGKGLKAMIEEATTPESFKMGEKFENYVREYIFTDRYYEILERTHNYSTNKDYVKSSIKPDFTFKDKMAKREFYVEAKFRTSDYNGKIIWCNSSQLNRYKEFSKQKPVFIILGMGENPSKPEFLSIIPLNEAKYTGLFPSYVAKFQIDLHTPITSKLLWK